MAATPYESWRVDVAWRSAPDATAPDWTNETSNVDTIALAIKIESGRPTNRDDIRPTKLTVTFKNDSQTYTPGNTSSSLYPYVKTGRRIRIVDVIGGVEYPLFDGYLELPDITDWRKGTTGANAQPQTVTFTAVDRVGRADRSRPFVSTLGEYIRDNGGSALVGYWPLNGPGPRFAERSGNGRTPLRLWPNTSLNYSGAPDDDTSRAYTTGDPVAPADDLESLSMTLTTQTVGGLVVRKNSYALGTKASLDGIVGEVETRTFLPEVYVATTEVVTGAVWVNWDGNPTNDTPYLLTTVVSHGGGNYGIIEVYHDPVGAGQTRTWSVSVSGPLTGSITNLCTAASDRPTLVGFQYDYTNKTIQLWVGASTSSANLTGTAPTSGVIHSYLPILYGYSGRIAHAQLYVASAATWGQTQFLAQHRHGFSGLDRQRADERISTLCAYAGLSTTDLDLDRASTLMPTARLAGEHLAPLLRAAAQADYGLLLTNGRGQIVFQGRQRRYNPPLAETFDLTDLSPPLGWRTDAPVNTMDVSSPTQPAGHAENATSISQFQQYDGPSISLDTAIDADPANLAAFLVRMWANPRQRPPVLAFELLHMTTAVKQRILAVGIGDMIALSGLPAYAPEGVQKLHIEGITHTISVAGHRVEWTIGSVWGTAPGVPDVYPVVGQAHVGANTRLPF